MADLFTTRLLGLTRPELFDLALAQRKRHRRSVRWAWWYRRHARFHEAKSERFERAYRDTLAAIGEYAAHATAAREERDAALQRAEAAERKWDEARTILRGAAFVLKDHDCDAMPYHDGCLACRTEEEIEAVLAECLSEARSGDSTPATPKTDPDYGEPGQTALSAKNEEQQSWPAQQRRIAARIAERYEETEP